VIIGGHVRDKDKLKEFLEQFFAATKALSNSSEMHVVAVFEEPPSPECRELLILFEGTVM
jgi:hypothetical protein